MFSFSKVTTVAMVSVFALADTVAHAAEATYSIVLSCPSKADPANPKSNLIIGINPVAKLVNVLSPGQGQFYISPASASDGISTYQLSYNGTSEFHLNSTSKGPGSTVTELKSAMDFNLRLSWHSEVALSYIEKSTGDANHYGIAILLNLHTLTSDSAMGSVPSTGSYSNYINQTCLYKETAL